ncbi:V-type proton ATPase subunit c''2-like isoform X3 [Olea europaea var. sylvestris]|uniref:V-type proton ATPase subunit c''2-like isoform X3 n=1 Tax=Olea europaea var. sylvestris TaxID=158386 RepID=UPI000C1CD67D|nr:V-type proton ATPase subunit c''2-like isoform X3 [Olea europaea var. sylvestris]
MDEYHLRTVIQLAFKFYLDNFLISLCCYCNFFCYSFCYSRPLCFPRFHRMVTPAISWSRALVQISPYTFAVVGIAVAIRVSTLGTARGISFIESSLIGAAIKAPRVTSKNLIKYIF